MPEISGGVIWIPFGHLPPNAALQLQRARAIEFKGSLGARPLHVSLLGGVSLSTCLKLFSSTGFIFFQSQPRPNRRQQINQTKQQQRFRSRNQQNESGKENDNRAARPNRPTDKNRQFISRRLNIIEAQTKHKHSINSYPNFVCRWHSENTQDQIWDEQQNQA
jgi:hypothetical protein